VLQLAAFLLLTVGPVLLLVLAAPNFVADLGFAASSSLL
jgi:hypothetical protein